MVDEPSTPTETAHAEGQAAPASGSASVVVTSFTSRRAAERMVASLGHRFRHQARSGSAAAFVVTRDPDGSFKLAQSRVVTATGVVANVSKFTAIVMAGLIGIGPAIKGVKAARHRAHQRQSGVGQDADRLARVFDRLDPHGACVLFHCTDEQTAQAVVTRADERGDHGSHYAQTEFLALLDRLGTDYDWIRPAVAEPVPRAKKKRRSARKPPVSGQQGAVSADQGGMPERVEVPVGRVIPVTMSKAW
jgi:uncharacterized membrane protein